MRTTKDTFDAVKNNEFELEVTQKQLKRKSNSANLNPCDLVLDKCQTKELPNSTLELEKNTGRDKIFTIKHKCNNSAKKHMLTFEQINILENYYFKDPNWSTDTVEQATQKLGLSQKKVYKWGYDRKHYARAVKNIPKLSPSQNDYNLMVDEILELKAKEMNLKKRKYVRRNSLKRRSKPRPSDSGESYQSVSEEDKYQQEEESRLFDQNKFKYDSELYLSNDQHSITIDPLNDYFLEEKYSPTLNELAGWSREDDLFENIKEGEFQAARYKESDFTASSPNKRQDLTVNNFWSTSTEEYGLSYLL